MPRITSRSRTRSWMVIRSIRLSWSLTQQINYLSNQETTAPDWSSMNRPEALASKRDSLVLFAKTRCLGVLFRPMPSTSYLEVKTANLAFGIPRWKKWYLQSPMSAVCLISCLTVSGTQDTTCLLSVASVSSSQCSSMSIREARMNLTDCFYPELESKWGVPELSSTRTPSGERPRLESWMTNLWAGVALKTSIQAGVGADKIQTLEGQTVALIGL